MSVIKLYTTQICPFCISAKRLLDDKGLSYTEISVDNDPQKRMEMMELSGQRTVPQIWIGQTHVGGCSELWSLERQGELDLILAKAS